MDELSALQAEAEARIAGAASLADLEAAEVQYLGRKGSVAGLMRVIPTLPPEERPGFVQRVTAVKDALSRRLGDRRA